MIDKIIKTYTKLAAPIKKNWNKLDPSTKSMVVITTAVGVPIKIAALAGAYYLLKDKTPKDTTQKEKIKKYMVG
jgi:hypothetical protein